MKYRTLVSGPARVVVLAIRVIPGNHRKRAVTLREKHIGSQLNAIAHWDEDVPPDSDIRHRCRDRSLTRHVNSSLSNAKTSVDQL